MCRMWTCDREECEHGVGTGVNPTMVSETRLGYYEQQINRMLQGIHICGCRYNERLKDNTDGST